MADVASSHEEITMHGKEKRSVADLVQTWGHSTSIALFDAACTIFSIPTIDGGIGYRMQSTCAVVFGDPVCSPHDLLPLTQAFHAFCKNEGKSVVYVATSQQFAHWALKHICQKSIGIGDEVIINPMLDQKMRTGADASSLRNKYNNCQRQGIVVKEYSGFDEQLEKSIEEVGALWLQNRRGPQRCLFSKVDIFADRSNKRWFYAELNGTILGVLMINRIDAHQGWVLNLLMVIPDAPNPTSEFIVLCALDILRTEQCSFFSIGTTTTNQLGAIEGFSAFSSWLLRKAFKKITKILKLNNHQRYWKKFQPYAKPSYVVFSQPRIKIQEIIGIMRAFNVKL